MYLHNGRIQPGHFKVQRGGGRNFTIHPNDFETTPAVFWQISLVIWGG